MDNLPWKTLWFLRLQMLLGFIIACCVSGESNEVFANPTTKTSKAASKPSVLLVFRQLQSSSVKKRLDAVRSMRHLAMKEEFAWLALATATHDSSRQVREATNAVILSILLKNGTLNQSLLLALQSPSKTTRWMASRALSLGGASMVPTLITFLQHKSAWVRLGAARALGFVGKPAASAVPRLLACLNDSKSTIRKISATALGKIGADEKQVVPALSRLLDDKKLIVVHAATNARARFRSKAILAVPALLRQYSKPNCLHCTLVSVALGKIGTVAIPLILRQLQRAKKTDVVVGLLGGLSEMGEKAGSVVPALTALLQHKHVDIRVAAAGALWNIEVGSPKTVQVLRKTLRDPSLRVRAFSARALSSMGIYAKAALPELRLALRDSHSWVIREAVQAIGKIGKDAVPALPDLFPLLHHAPSVYVRTYAAQAIGRIGCTRLAAKAALLKALKDSKSWVRHWTVDALIKCKASSPLLVKHLRPLLQDKDPSVVRSVKKALRLLVKPTTRPSSPR